MKVACEQEAQRQFSESPDLEWLMSQKITGADLPMWIAGRKSLGIHTVNPGKALAKGMTFRSLETSCDDAAKWNPTRPVERQQNLHAWPMEREQETLLASAKSSAAQ
jgi:hypothetical protein